METHEDEVDRRRELLTAAAKGDPLAREKLRELYHVNIYSPAEREQFNKNVKALPKVKAKTTNDPK